MWKLYPPVTPPAKSPTPYWAVRGVYCGIRLDKKSTGATTETAARNILKTWMGLAEKGEFAKAPPAPTEKPLTFGRAARAYMGAETDEGYKGRALYLTPIIAAWEDRVLADIDQHHIDELAKQLHPLVSPATRNRQVYTPVSCVLKHGLGKDAWTVRRPKGAGGEKTTYSFSPAQAFPILEQLYAIEIELGVLCELLLYTGLRLGEALKLTIGDLDLGGARLIARKTKNGKARIAHLPPAAVAALRNHPRGLDRPADARLFRFHKGGSLTRLHHAAIAQAGLSAAFPERQGFHLWRHTYATWQAEINEMSAYDLVRTGAWSDPSSAERYNHASKSKQARGADNFPTRPHLRLVKEVA